MNRMETFLPEMPLTDPTAHSRLVNRACFGGICRHAASSSSSRLPLSFSSTCLGYRGCRTRTSSPSRALNWWSAMRACQAVRCARRSPAHVKHTRNNGDVSVAQTQQTLEHALIASHETQQHLIYVVTCAHGKPEHGVWACSFARVYPVARSESWLSLWLRKVLLFIL